MRPAFLICSLLLLAASGSRADSDSHHSDEECDCSRGGRDGGGFRVNLLRTRADNNDVEINRLFQAADKLEKNLHHLDEGPDVAELKARVDTLTGNDCGYHMFECVNHGGCVNPLQVCDGEYDCADHSDESDETCKILMSEGSSWGAAVSHHECFREAADHVRVVIAKVDRSEILPSSAHLEVTTFLYVAGDINVGHAEGYYNFGTRTGSFRATDGDIVDMECVFNGVDENSCHAHMHRGLERRECGELVFIRE